jgi:predicted small secreted protein
MNTGRVVKIAGGQALTALAMGQAASSASGGWTLPEFLTWLLTTAGASMLVYGTIEFIDNLVRKGDPNAPGLPGDLKYFVAIGLAVFYPLAAYAGLVALGIQAWGAEGVFAAVSTAIFVANGIHRVQEKKEVEAVKVAQEAEAMDRALAGDPILMTPGTVPAILKASLGTPQVYYGGKVHPLDEPAIDTVDPDSDMAAREMSKQAVDPFPELTAEKARAVAMGLDMDSEDPGPDPTTTTQKPRPSHGGGRKGGS